VTTAQDGGKVVSLRHRPPLPQEMLQVLSRNQCHSAIGRILCQWKIPMTQAGIEPATFRYIAQHLNHCARAVANLKAYKLKYIWRHLLFGTDFNKRLADQMKTKWGYLRAWCWDGRKAGWGKLYSEELRNTYCYTVILLYCYTVILYTVYCILYTVYCILYTVILLCRWHWEWLKQWI